MGEANRARDSQEAPCGRISGSKPTHSRGAALQCLDDAAGSDLGTFELLIKVGKEGTIEEITGGGNSPLMSCLGHKINDFRLSKQAVFPPPPQPDYWVRLDFNQDASSAALK